MPVSREAAGWAAGGGASLLDWHETMHHLPQPEPFLIPCSQNQRPRAQWTSAASLAASQSPSLQVGQLLAGVQSLHSADLYAGLAHIFNDANGC